MDNILILHSIILGTIQGITEFLPISSSAHLVILPYLLKWNYQGLGFDVALHFGSLIAIILYFNKKWILLIKNSFRKVNTIEKKLFWYIIISTIPACITGYFLEKYAENIFRTPFLIGLSLIFFSFVMLISDKYGKKTLNLESLCLKNSLFIGICQAIAILPGVSRSGITISAGLLAGLKRSSAAEFSFLLATPVIFGASIFELKNFFNTNITNINFYLLFGFIFSIISSLTAIKFLLYYLKKYSLSIFVIYRIILGIILIFLDIFY